MNFQNKKTINHQLQDHHQSKIPVSLSFEFFPPKEKHLEDNLLKKIQKFILLKPSFLSITCGINDKNQKTTYKLVKKIKKTFQITTVPHLTCINNTKYKLKEIAKNYWKNGIKTILALRGDVLEKKEKTNKYAIELIEILKKIKNFNIIVAAYPEVHPEAKSKKSDLLNLKKKFDAGANSAITQFFFDTNKYLRFRDNCAKIGIYQDIIPGILAISDLQKLKNFSSITNVKVPKKIYTLLEEFQPNSTKFNIVSAQITNSIIEQLYKEGVKKFHFYTLNKLNIPYTLSHILKKK